MDEDEMVRFTFGPVGFSMFPSKKTLIVVDEVFIPELLREKDDSPGPIVIIGKALVPAIHRFFMESGENPALLPKGPERMTPLEEWILDVMREISNERDPNLRLWPLTLEKSSGNVPAFTRKLVDKPVPMDPELARWVTAIQKFSRQ